MKLNLYWIAATDSWEHTNCATVVAAASMDQAMELVNTLPAINGKYSVTDADTSTILCDTENFDFPQVIEFMEVRG